MKKTALYAGAFNPPTLAHKKVLTGVLDNGLVDEVIFAPTGERSDKSYGIESRFRERILEIFYQEVVQEGYPVIFSDYFLKNKNDGETTTLSMHRYFQNMYQTKLFHIFGIDVIDQIPLWKENENKQIENTLEKIFIHRYGYIIPDPFPMKKSTLVDLGTPGISSTLAREMIRTKRDIHSILSPGVATFIQENNLYL